MLKISQVYFSLLILIGLSQSSFATTLVPVNLVQLSESSEYAFVGTVENVQTIKTSNTGYGQQVTVKIQEKVFGIPDTSSTISWIQAKTSKNTVFPSMPQYQIGGKYLIYLTGKSAGSPFQAPQAFGYGMFHIFQNPGTNQQYARNSFMNGSLLKNTDVSKLALETISRQSGVRNLNSDEVDKRVLNLKSSLTSRVSGGTDLNSLVETSRAIREIKKSGGNVTKALYLDSGKK